jgi:hypothetical protein
MIYKIEETHPLRGSIQLEVFSIQFLACSFTIYHSQLSIRRRGVDSFAENPDNLVNPV